MSNKKRKITPKENKFLSIFLKTGDKTKSAEKAYNLGSKGGSKTEKQRKKVASEIGQRVSKKLAPEIDAYYKKQKIDNDWVLKRLVNKADFARKEEIQLKATELIGKNQRMFVDRVETKLDVSNLKIEFANTDFKKDAK